MLDSLSEQEVRMVLDGLRRRTAPIEKIAVTGPIERIAGVTEVERMPPVDVTKFKKGG
jgi:hypothetical protein